MSLLQATLCFFLARLSVWLHLLPCRALRSDWHGRRLTRTLHRDRLGPPCLKPKIMTDCARGMVTTA